jgi:predicted TIM-barrel fold metal-dependent hydrolase
MRKYFAFILLFLLAMSFTFSQTQAAPAKDEAQILGAFAALHPIDTHVHIFKTDPAFQSMLEKLNLKVLNILVMDDTMKERKELKPQVDEALSLMRGSHGHIAFCTTFDPYKFNSPTFTKDAIEQINQNFADGAIAVKLWKNVGMEIKDANGKYILADNPKFEPIYQDIQKNGKTLLTHQAEPNVAWGPPDPSDPSWSYYKENPQWYLGDKQGYPSKQEILTARDHILANNPKLKMVGVHLGSMEKSLQDMAQHLDKYPNFAIDTAARMDYLMLMPHDDVRNFLIKYQDRVVYGTDLDVNEDANVAESIKDWQSAYVRDYKFLATDETQTVMGKESKGLNLPKAVLQKIFHDNAKKWIPGM